MGTIRTKIQFRRDTAANWFLYKDVISAAGEPCFEIDTGIFKIGDGVTTYENLKDIGGACLSADGKSIVIEDGVLKLVGFDLAEVGAQPRKTADGNIEWVVPSTDTVDGLQTAVAGLQSDVTKLQSNVASIQEIVGSSEESTSTLLDRVAAIEGKVGETSVDEKINTAFDDFMAKVSDDGTINTVKELIDYVATHAPEAVQMAADIAALQTGKVDAVEGKSLIADTLVAKLEAIEDGAQVNKIEAIKVGDTLLEVVDKTVIIPIGAGLKTSDEITIAEDGTIGIGQISVSKLVQDEDSELIFDGGGASK